MAGALKEFFGMMQHIGFKGYPKLTISVSLIILLLAVLPKLLGVHAARADGLSRLW